MKDKIESYAKVAGIIAAIFLIAFSCMNTYTEVKRSFDLEKLRASEASFLQPLNDLAKEKESYQQTMIQVAKDLYTDQRLYALYKTFENKFGGSFSSLSIEPGYTKENNLKWFNMNIAVKGLNPLTFFTTIRDNIPPLYIVSFSINSGVILASVKGLIGTTSNGFFLTPQLLQTEMYSIYRLVAVAKDESYAKDLIAKQPGLLIIKNEDKFYIGERVATQIDGLTAESIAIQYEETKGIMFIVKEAK